MTVSNLEKLILIETSTVALVVAPAQVSKNLWQSRKSSHASTEKYSKQFLRWETWRCTCAGTPVFRETSVSVQGCIQWSLRQGHEGISNTNLSYDMIYCSYWHRVQVSSRAWIVVYNWEPLKNSFMHLDRQYWETFILDCCKFFFLSSWYPICKAWSRHKLAAFDRTCYEGNRS